MLSIMTSYSWKWHRAHGKAFVMLLKDGKKIGSVRDMYMFSQCDCGPYYNCYGGMTESEVPYERVAAYIGGKKIGMFQNVIDAKMAVEHDLGITTRKPKTPEPERIAKPHTPAKEVAAKKTSALWCKKWAARKQNKTKQK